MFVFCSLCSIMECAVCLCFVVNVLSWSVLCALCFVVNVLSRSVLCVCSL